MVDLSLREWLNIVLYIIFRVLCTKPYTMLFTTTGGNGLSVSRTRHKYIRVIHLSVAVIPIIYLLPEGSLLILLGNNGPGN